MPKPSFDDVMKWVGLRDRLKARMSDEERKAWSLAAEMREDVCAECLNCTKCQLYSAHETEHPCITVVASTHVRRGHWREARTLCDQIVKRLTSKQK